MPAQVAGSAIDDALALRILDDVREREMPPLFAFTLQTLWRSRVAGQPLTLEAYLHDAQGGDPVSAHGSPVESIIRRTADAAVAGMNAGDLAALRHALLRMIHVTRDGRLTRRRVARSSLPAGSQGLIDRLLSCRLLVVDGPEIEPAHEALYEAWPRLKESVEESREALIVLDEIEYTAEQYIARPGAEYLWPRARLRERTRCWMRGNSFRTNRPSGSGKQRGLMRVTWRPLKRHGPNEKFGAFICSSTVVAQRRNRCPFLVAGGRPVGQLAGLSAMDEPLRRLPPWRSGCRTPCRISALCRRHEAMRRSPSPEAERALRHTLSMVPKPSVQLCNWGGRTLPRVPTGTS